MIAMIPKIAMTMKALIVIATIVIAMKTVRREMMLKRKRAKVLEKVKKEKYC
jgi:hypothetical protein